MKPFEDFLRRGEVTKISVDKNLAKSLLEQAERRLRHVGKEIIIEENRDFVIEDYYEALRTLADALLALRGYKTYSHEAAIAQVQDDKDISQGVIESFDRLRRQRHGSRYYGTRLLLSDAEDTRRFAHDLAAKLKRKIETALADKRST